MWLCFLRKQKAKRIVTKVHLGLCGVHQSKPKYESKDQGNWIILTLNNHQLHGEHIMLSPMLYM